MEPVTDDGYYRFVQIAACGGDWSTYLFALDVAGNVWTYRTSTKSWTPLPSRRDEQL